MAAAGTGFHILPPGEDRCVWMSAGVLSYQLCDHRFDCDCCPLDAAMRRRRSPLAESQARPAPPPATALPPGRRYSAGHCWAQDQRNGRVRIGLEPGFASALPPPRQVVYPSPGQQLTRGRTCLWIVLDEATLSVQAPLDGRLTAINGQVPAAPHLLVAEPLDHGWLLELDAGRVSPGGDALMDAESAALAYADDQSRFTSLVHDAMRGRGASPDSARTWGGPQIESVVRALGAGRYVRLLRQAFRN